MINIITINKDNKEGLKKTIESVVNQTFFDKINYIIIDGASSDGSNELIKQYQDKLYYWCSEEDNGIFHAMNKGIDAAPDEGYCLFLNSGDYLETTDVIEKIYDELDKDIVYGNEIKVEYIKQPLVSYTTMRASRAYTARYPDKITEDFFRKGALPHQSTFIKTSLQKQYKYSEDWKLLGDWKFFREMIMVKRVPYKHIKTVISVYSLDGVSTTNRKLHDKEKMNYYTKL